jgi:cell division septation protein DedD
MRRSSSIGCVRYDIGVHGCTRTLRSIAGATVTLAALGALAGCPGDSTAPTLASVTDRYESGQYQRALEEADAVAARGPSADRAQAELVAGMAAFQLDRFSDAEQRFLAAERSGNQTIRGRARVMLANIRLEQGRMGDAAALFDSGAADLTGADAEKARRYASLARDGQIGTGEPRMPVVQGSTAARVGAIAPPAAPPAIKPALAPTTSVATQSRASAAQTASTPDTPDADAAARGIFTVRAGAYTTEAAARRRAKALAADVRRAKCPEPHIAAVRTKDGDTLYAVRIGTFKSRADAEALLKRLARKDLAVGAL